MAYPIVFLTPWLLTCLLDRVQLQSTTSNVIAAKDLIGANRSLDFTPVVRISQFLKKTGNSELGAVLNDGTHKLFALFTRQCIRDFERKYLRRLTRYTLHSLVIIKRANLRFARLKQEILGLFGFWKELNPIISEADVVYLEILEIKVFSWDQVRVSGYHENRLKLVYCEEKYRHKYGKRSVRKDLDGLLLSGADGMICDELDLI